MSEWEDPWTSEQLLLSSQTGDAVPWYNQPDRLDQLQAMRVKRALNRYYCPECGEVGYGYQGHLGWVVESHTRCEADKGARDYRFIRCPGGTIDPTKDKAP